MRKRFPATLPRDLRKHYQEIHFRSKIDFLETYQKQQLAGIVCHECAAIYRFLGCPSKPPLYNMGVTPPTLAVVGAK